MAKDKATNADVLAGIDTSEYTFINSTEDNGIMIAVYAKQVPAGLDKRTIIIENGILKDDTTEFKVAAYMLEWTKNGKPFRYELIGG